MKGTERGREITAWLEDLLEHEPNKAVTFPEFVPALIGVANADNAAVYDYNRCVSILCDKYRWSRHEAQDWLDHNVIDAGYGNATAPVFVFDPFEAP